MGLPDIDLDHPIPFDQDGKVRYDTRVPEESLAHAMCWLLAWNGFHIFDTEHLNALIDESAKLGEEPKPVESDARICAATRVFPVIVLVHDEQHRTRQFESPWLRQELPFSRVTLELFVNKGVFSPVLDAAVPNTPPPLSVRAILAAWEPFIRGDVEEHDAPVQLVGGNSIVEASCACDVAPMDSAPVDIQVWTGASSPVLEEVVKRSFVASTRFTDPSNFRFVKVPPGVAVRTAAHVFEQQTGYHANWYAGSAVKNGRLIASTDRQFMSLFRFEEQCYYAQRALLVGGAAGITGQIHALALPVNASAPLAERSRNAAGHEEEVRLTVHDGWGYIKQCLAEKLSESNPTLSKVGTLDVGTQAADDSVMKTRVNLAAPRSSYQMFQWFRAQGRAQIEAENEAVSELARAFAKPSNRPPEPSEWHKWVSEPWARNLLSHAPMHYAAHPLVRRVLRRALVQAFDVRMLTGDPPLSGGVAMPVVPGPVVMPVCDRLNDFSTGEGGLALFRFPADTMNWVTTLQVDRTSALANFLGTMEAVQYTLLANHADSNSSSPELFAKGMLGVIPDALWPRAWKETSLVLCHEDIKANAAWWGPASAAIDKTCPLPRWLDVTGALTICQWYAAGNCVGVPFELQHRLAGDYDGDQVVMLAQAQLPATYAYIHTKSEERTVNPKLEKTLKPMGEAESRIGCIEKVHRGASLVGTWTNLSSHLLRLDDEQLSTIAAKVDIEGGAAALLSRVSLGIKEGTDAFKTHVNIDESQQLASRLLQELRHKGQLAPYARWKRHPEVVWARAEDDGALYGLVSKLYWTLVDDKFGVNVLPDPASARQYVCNGPLHEIQTLLTKAIARAFADLGDTDDPLAEWTTTNVPGTPELRRPVVLMVWNAIHESASFPSIPGGDEGATACATRAFGRFVETYWEDLAHFLPRDI